MKINKEQLRNEYAKVWKNDSKMINYCVDKAAAVAELVDGELVVIDKQRIEKRFCFGESGYDYEDAQKAAAHARTSEEYFKTENMKYFKGWIAELINALNGGDYRLVINERTASDGCKIHGVSLERLTDIIDACGGSCYLYDLPGKRLNVRGKECRIAYPKDYDILIDAYKEAADAHEKKVNAYLKRYGTSQVRSWTYWRDA